MANRYQRRRYGSGRPPRKASSVRWQIYLLLLVIILAVLYFRVFR